MFVPLFLEQVRIKDRPDVFLVFRINRDNKQSICFVLDGALSSAGCAGPCSKLRGGSGVRILRQADSWRTL
jgi:hypothetical protein